jgi:stage IV sporulation protein FB
MGWEDRPYYRDRRSSSNAMDWLLSGSVHLFTIFGIRVRIQSQLLILISIVLLFGLGGFGTTVVMRVQSMATLFLIILLHEFGHCFAARSVGGTADEIVMTPLGGLAMAMAPRRWWPTLVTVAGGPAVNVVICLVCGLGIYLILGIFPLGPWTLGNVYDRISQSGWLSVASYLFWVYAWSYGMLLFNLIPVYPLDGGQMLQATLWKWMGFYKSMMLALNIGLVGSVLMVMAGVATFGMIGGGLLMILIGFSCFMNCFQTRAMMKAEGPWAFTEEDTSFDYGAASRAALRPQRRGLGAKWSAMRARNQAREAQNEQTRIDAILAKVSAKGMQSLNWREKRTLKKATERQRQRDLELARGRSR